MKSKLNLPRKEHLFVLYIFAISFGFYLFIQTRHPFVYECDGPYYLSQVRGLLENGRLEYPSLNPLSFYIFTFFTLLFNRDATFGIRFCVALFSALTAIPFYFWVKKVTGSELSGYVAMMACTFSAPHIRFLYYTYNQVVSVFFLLCFVTSLQSLVNGENVKRAVLFASASLILTAVTHQATFYLALLFLMVYSSVALFLGVKQKTILITYSGTLLITVLISALITYFVYPTIFWSYFSRIPTYLHGKLNPETAETAISNFFTFDLDWGLYIIPALTAGLALTIYELKTGKREQALTITAVTIIGLTLLLPFILLTPEHLWRFIVIEFIPMAFIIGYGASKLQPKTSHTMLLFLCLSPLIIQSATYSTTIRPSITENEYRELELIAELLPPNSVIVTNFHCKYWIEHITRTKAEESLSPALLRNYEHVFYLRYHHGTITSDWTKITEIDHFILYESKSTISK